MTDDRTESTEPTAAPEESAHKAAPEQPADTAAPEPAADTAVIERADTAATEPAGAAAPEPADAAAIETGPASHGTSPAEADAAAGPQSLTERPEVLVRAAFAGGLLLALILRAVGND